MRCCRGVAANNCARYGYIVSRGGGFCLVVGLWWLTIVLDIVTLLAAVVDYALLSGRWLIIMLNMVILLARVVEYALLSGVSG